MLSSLSIVKAFLRCVHVGVSFRRLLLCPPFYELSEINTLYNRLLEYVLSFFPSISIREKFELKKVIKLRTKSLVKHRRKSRELGGT